MKNRSAAAAALAAAALYAVNIPLSKLLLQYVAPTAMAAFLYLGAGIGLALYLLFRRAAGKTLPGEPLTRRELPFTAAMVLLDIAAPILLMFGITRTSAANVSLLNNFEIAATAFIALLLFGERISKRLWFAIALITAAGILLGFEGTESIRFNTGSFFVLAACVCWGFENNCTRKLSGKSTVEIVTVKGCFSGLGSLIVSAILREPLPAVRWIFCAMLLGFVSYGLSINFYILAQRNLGAAKTSAFYSVAPFFGVGFSVLFLGERPGILFYPALAVMAAAAVLLARDSGGAAEKEVRK